MTFIEIWQSLFICQHLSINIRTPASNATILLRVAHLFDMCYDRLPLLVKSTTDEFISFTLNSFPADVAKRQPPGRPRIHH